MSEQIFTFTAVEVDRMLKSGQMRLLTTPSESAQKEQTEHEKALEKAKRIFGKDFEDVQTLEIGGKSVEELRQALGQAGINVSSHAEEMLSSPDFTILPSPRNIELVKIDIQKLGFKKEDTIDHVFQKAQESGLSLCPPEVGPYLRLKDVDQSYDNRYYIAMDQIENSLGYSIIFEIWRNQQGLYLLDVTTAESDGLDRWYFGDELVFCLL